MDSGFKSPRPPAPRRSRSRATSLSRVASSRGGSNGENIEETTSNPTAKLTASSLRTRLEGLLVAKSNEIVLAGRLGESLLNQQAELEARIRELEEDVQHDKAATNAANGRADRATYEDSDDDSVLGQEAREKLQTLESELKRWERGNDEIYKVVGLPSGTSGELVRQASHASMKSRPSTPPPPLPTSSVYDDISNASEATPTSPSSSRRQRNAQHRANDIEFATEIGQSLLIEVRRLQALLSERDGQLAASKAEKDGMERSMESLASGLKSVEESLDKYREENWNLEVSNQEIRTQNSEISSNLSKVEGERIRLVKELSSAREMMDTHKLDNERLVVQLDNFKNKHETDMANMRRTTAGLQREKTDIQSALDIAKNELVAKTRGIRRSVSAASNATAGTGSAHGHGGLGDEETDEEEEDDVFGTNKKIIGGRRKTNDYLDSPGAGMFSDGETETPDGSPAVRRGGSGLPELNDNEQLRNTLGHAQKTIQTLRAALIREKESRMNLKRKMKGGEGAASEEDDDDDDDEEEDTLGEDMDENDENQPEKRRRTITAGRRGRGGRGGRGVIASSRRGGLIGRLPRGLQPSRLSSEVPADEEEDGISETGGDGSIVEHGDVSMSSEQEELASLPGDDSRDYGNNELRASRSSVASMDPAFADILPSSSTSGITGRGGQGGILGGSMRDNRPNSMMFSGDFNLAEQLQKQEEEMAALRYPPKVEVREMAMMTDDLPPPPVPEPVIQRVEVPVIQRVEVPVIQRVEVPAPKPESKEISLQTDEIPPPPTPEPVIQRVEIPVIQRIEVPVVQRVEVPAPKPESREASLQTDEIPPPPIPEPVVQRVEVPVIQRVEVPVIERVEVPAPKPQSREFSLQTDDIPPPPLPEPVIHRVEVPVIQRVEIAPPKPESREFSLQTDEIPPPPVPEPRIVHVEVPVPAQKPESREFSIQTDDVPPPPAPEPIYVEVPVRVEVPAPQPPKPELREYTTQTEKEQEVEKSHRSLQTEGEDKIESREMASMTESEAAVEQKDMQMMTEATQSGEMSIQTEEPAGKSYSEVLAIEFSATAAPAKILVERGLDPHVDLSQTSTIADLSMRSFEDEATTPTLESMPTFGERLAAQSQQLGSQFARRPAYSGADRSVTQDSSVAPSFKSFQATDYDTATETDGDFEDARETLATFDHQSPSMMMNLSNASHSTILRSGVDSDQESDFGGSSVQATPRFPRVLNRKRTKELLQTREIGTSPIKEEKQPELEPVSQPIPEPVAVPEPAKPVLVDAGIQTDDLPAPTFVSPTSIAFSDTSSQVSIPPEQGRRSSAATFGISGPRRDSEDVVPTSSVIPPGFVYLDRVGTQQPLTSTASTISRRSSVNTSTSYGGDSFVPPPMPVSPSKTRAPKLSIPPPPALPPPSNLMKQSTTPSFRPPRPSSPPPPELLQRAQTPTFLAPGSVSRKRASASESSSAANGQYNNMILLRNENNFGAATAPLPHNRTPSGPRAVASAAQLRNAPPIRYQAASTEPGEFGEQQQQQATAAAARAQGASTPINQTRPASRFGSTKRRTQHGDTTGRASRASRASVSSIGSTHSRNHSIASSARTSEVGDDDLPHPNSARGPPPVPGSSTDPAVLHNITQTMIGEYLFKYTRNNLTGNLSDKRHQRFFWIHPYTKSLYWGNSDPGSSRTNESKSKSVYIAGVRVENDTNPYPPGLYQKSIIIHTGSREIKLTAPTKERHEMWMSAIQYLLVRPDGTPPTPSASTRSRGGGADPGTPASSRRFSLGKSISRSASSMRFRQKSDPMTLEEVGMMGRSTTGSNDATLVSRNRSNTTTLKNKDKAAMYKQESQSEPRLTPKPKTRGSTATNPSMYKRSDTPAADYQSHIQEFGSPRSVRSYAGVRPGTSMSMNPGLGGGADDSMEIIDRRDALGAHGEQDGGDGYEGLENVRACCNGAHDVGKLSVSRKHHHHHHHHQGNEVKSSKDSQASSTMASRNNSMASRASRRTTNSSLMMTTAGAQEQQPPVPTRFDEPGSPSLRASTAKRGRNNSSSSQQALSNVFANDTSGTVKGKSRARE